MKRARAIISASATRARRVRAFALPLVILLTLVVSLAVGVLMQRNSVGYLAARRQADSYINNHAGLGMREMVSQWLSTVRGRLRESLEDDGYAFSLELPGGDRVDVFFDDAQGSVLSRTDMLTGRRREIVEMMNAYLDVMEQTGREMSNEHPGEGLGPRESFEVRQRAHGRAGEPIETMPMKREWGPSEISIRTAPVEVLEALASAVTDPKKAQKVAEALVKRRDDQSTTRDLAVDEVTRTLRELDVGDEAIREIGAMLVYTPTLYRVTAEQRSSNGELISKAVGLLEVKDNRGDVFSQNAPFLTWETVPLEDEPQGGLDR